MFKPVLQYFATGSDTASCEDFEEYEFPERLSEETQIVDSFTHCKLQSHTLSQIHARDSSEFLERLSEETQIVDSFTRCKLQPHSLSQYTHATRQNSC